MQLLTEISDPNAAQLLAARLRAEGIEARISSEAEGPYRLTIGSMATTQLWVDEADLSQARMLLEEIEEDSITPELATTEAATSRRSTSIGRSLLWWVVAAALLGYMLWTYAGRFF